MKLQIQEYARNTEGKDYVVGDIHGNFRQLMNILFKMDFDFKKDRLFSVGDLCDRGLHSEEILKWLEFKWFIPVIGNHETLILGYQQKTISIETLIKVGAQWWFDLEEYQKQTILTYFDSLPIALEVDTKQGKVGIVHAACPTDSWKEFKLALTGTDGYKYAHKAIWTYAKDNEKRKIADIDYVIVGHTTQDEYAQWENVFLIDTGATFKEGYFTILDLATLQPVNYQTMNLV